MRALSLPLCVLLAACGTTDATDSAPDPAAEDSDTTGIDTDAPGPADTDVATDTDLPGDTDLSGDTDAPADTDPGVNTGVVRFVAIGDAGEGNDDQYAVAAAVEEVCAERGCEFALYLGDNFYDDGVHAADDPQFTAKFEDPYADLDFPFWVVLGNHDFGEVPVQFWRTDFQVDYTQHSTKWTMPDHFYAFDQAHATFIGLDTNKLMLPILGGVADQRTLVRKTVREARAAGQQWVIAYGHHPWRSNGKHGNAGNYEGVPIDPVGGIAIRDFFRKEMCNKVDIYLCGHDHNRQWLDPVCGVELIVSGAGAKTSDFVRRDKNGTIYENDQKEGFVWIELDGPKATVAFYNLDAELEHEGVIVK